MSIVDQLRWSLRHSKRQLFESILVVAAISLGVGVIVTVLSLLLSVNQQYGEFEYEDYFRTFELISQADFASRSGVPLVLVGTESGAAEWRASLAEVEELQRHLPDTMHAFVEMSWSVRTLLELSEVETPFPWMEANEIFLTGTTPEYFNFKNYTLERGNWFLSEDLREKNRVVVLSSGLAQELFGEEDPIGQIIPLESFREEESIFYTVIGVLAPIEKAQEPYFTFREARTAYTPVTASPYTQGGEEVENRFSRVSIGVDAGVDLVRAHELAKSEANLIWGEAVGVRSPLGDFQEMRKELQRYALLIGVFASVGLVIAVINILNLMLARVLKRTKGIGLSMALGSSRRLVFRQFVLEALSLGVIGSVIGVLLSFGLSVVLEKALGAPLISGMYGTRILLGVTIGFAVSLLFGVYPAYLGSRINPVDALRTD